MKQLMSYFVALLCFLPCYSAFADTTPTTSESKYFMGATNCYQKKSSFNNPPLAENVTRWDGNLNYFTGKNPAAIECAIPLEHDRDIASVVISVYVSNVELRSCQMFVEYAGSNISLGYFDIVPYKHNLEHFRLDNIGSFPRVSSGGHDLVGAVILCSTSNNPINTKNRGFTRFRSIRVDYN